MARLTWACLLLTVVAALAPRLAFAAQWGSAYGDPPGFCPALSGLPGTYRSYPITNDPTVAYNPEAGTFFGFHSDPGYDDWFGYWYGDFRGTPGDASGWRFITRVYYPNTGHWNFSDWGWAVHGHAKQYIAYYNWTFGGQCGMGWYGSPSPAPFMADVYGVPVADFYVDTMPPLDPQPRVSAITPSSISFTWDPVPDQADGAGADAVAVGMGSYRSWLSINHGAAIDYQVSSAPIVQSTAATSSDVVCVHVVAADALGNATGVQQACGSPAGTPPAPPPPPAVGVAANPVPGIAGLPGWFWLQPAPAAVTTDETVGGVSYQVTATPASADWDFGDGAALAGAGFGSAYPTPSAIRHAYDAESATGFAVAARVNYSLSWWWRSGATWVGPYPLGTQAVDAAPLAYPVMQAQPELVAVG